MVNGAEGREGDRMRMQLSTRKIYKYINFQISHAFSWKFPSNEPAAIEPASTLSAASHVPSRSAFGPPSLAVGRFAPRKFHTHEKSSDHSAQKLEVMAPWAVGV